MDGFKDFDKDTITSPHAQYEQCLEEQTTCCLCGSDLRFLHHIDYVTLLVREDAHCPSCRIQLKSREHTLQ